MARATVLLAVLLAFPAAAAAQDPPPCPPDKTMDARLTVQEGGEDSPLVATHAVELTADIADRTAPVSSPPDRVVIMPESGVEVLGDGSGSTIAIFAPATPTLTVVVSWRQTVDPANSDETAKCSANHTFTLPVLAARPARGAKQPNPGPDTGDFTFAIAAAEAKRGDLRPLVVSIRSTGHLRLPRANERLRTWTIPMREDEQLKYRGRLPNLAYATTAQKCRFWWLTCGPVFAEVASLNFDDRALNRGIERPDLDGSNSILRTLAYSQPARWAAPLGIVVSARGGAHQKPFGYDVQVRQAGRLLARVRRVGRCVLERRSSGSFRACRLTRSSTLLR
ncbi:MAG TPA: hypothetical protein VF056_13520 [Thermoleophilaceae bacterium]